MCASGARKRLRLGDIAHRFLSGGKHFAEERAILSGARLREALAEDAPVSVCEVGRAACPVCNRRDVTLHHLTYRSVGGGDEAENLVSICAFHHLDGEHGGRLKVTGKAGQMTWRLGPTDREPVMVIVGRERC